MSNISIAAGAVVPLLLMLSAGFVLRRNGIADETAFNNLNLLSFRFFFPVMLFRNMYSMNLSAVDWKPALYADFGVFILFLFLRHVVPHFDPATERQVVIEQGLFRGNTSVYGVPLSIAVLGAGNIGTTLVTLAANVPLLNVLAVVTLSNIGNRKTNYKTVFLNIIKNPYIIGVVAGLLCNFIKLPIPGIVMDAVEQVAAVATPISFVSLGGLFSFSSALKNRKTISIICLLRLVVIPCIMLFPALLLHMSGHAMIALLSIFATPTAVGSFTMVKSMGGDAELAGEIVVFTTALSMFTIFLWLWLMLSTGIIE